MTLGGGGARGGLGGPGSANPLSHLFYLLFIIYLFMKRARRLGGCLSQTQTVATALQES